jgi:hypothetical protein
MELNMLHLSVKGARGQTWWPANREAIVVPGLKNLVLADFINNYDKQTKAGREKKAGRRGRFDLDPPNLAVAWPG